MSKDWAGIVKTVFVVAFGILAGAGCHYHYMLHHPPEIQDKPVTWEVIAEEPIPAETVPEETPKEIPYETPEEIAEEIYYDSWELLAMCVEAEAGNQDLMGKRMVADVILNRVDAPDWPDTIEGVITKPYEITTWWNGRIEAAVPSEETYRAVAMELEERTYPELFYFSAEGYSKYGTPWDKYGDHYFSTK